LKWEGDNDNGKKYACMYNMQLTNQTLKLTPSNPTTKTARTIVDLSITKYSNMRYMHAEKFVRDN